MKCMVKKCENESHQGSGVILRAREVFPASDRKLKTLKTDEEFWICLPCFNFLRSASDTCSQVYRNAELLKKED